MGRVFYCQTNIHRRLISIRPFLVSALTVISLFIFTVPAQATKNSQDKSQAKCRSIAKSVFSHKKWRKKPRVNKLKGCWKKNPRYIKKLRDRFKLHKEYRKTTSFRGLRGEGYWLKWLSVPAWVVRAETNGYRGASRWRARNPSGACGPYQLLGHTSCNTNSAKDKLRHHRVAAGLPRGSWAVGYSSYMYIALTDEDVYWWQLGY